MKILIAWIDCQTLSFSQARFSFQITFSIKFAAEFLSSCLGTSIDRRVSVAGYLKHRGYTNLCRNILDVCERASEWGRDDGRENGDAKHVGVRVRSAKSFTLSTWNDRTL